MENSKDNKDATRILGTHVVTCGSPADTHPSGYTTRSTTETLQDTPGLHKDAPGRLKDTPHGVYGPCRHSQMGFKDSNCS